jgi:hypothetical protein
MIPYQSLICDDEERRQAVIEDVDFNGIDYIEVPASSLDAQRFLHVYFLTPDFIDSLIGAPGRFAISGGVRITDIRPLAVTRVDNHLVVEVNRPGDFSPYTLTVSANWVDPAFASKEFSFKAGCASDFDCRTEQPCLEEGGPSIPIDYLAKDYASFRRALLDLIPILAPDWLERNPADMGMALVELLAYTADRLSYYQDAVANEAYLETARQRISVRRHARLIDYHIHDGLSARTFVHIEVCEDPLCPDSGLIPAGTPVLSRITETLGATVPGAVIQADQKALALDLADVVFETLTDLRVHVALNEVDIYPWGNRQCCLPRGTTSLDLKGGLTAHLQSGDYLLFEEIRGPATGLRADADPKHRQVVRLTDVQRTVDPLQEQELTRVTWDRADALSFPLCLSVKVPTGIHGADRYVDNVSVARGNLVLADHGRTVSERRTNALPAPRHERQRRAHRFFLEQGPLSFRAPHSPAGPVAALRDPDPRQAKPQVVRLEVTGTQPTDDWQPVDDLLDSNAFDHHVVVETNNEGQALIRFGDDVYGQSPPDGAVVTVDYRTGIGRAGNVGRGALHHLVRTDGGSGPTWPTVTRIYNPLPAWGGMEPEPIEVVKRIAPAAFHTRQRRAVTEEDYARVAEKHPEVARAVATFRWTGSWHTVFVTIDPVGSTEVDLQMERDVGDWVKGFTQAGYDLEVAPPVYVPLEIDVTICVEPTHFRAHVREVVLTALSNHVLPGGGRGFFHPDNFTFNQPLYLSQLYAAVETVEGVDSVEVTRFKRFGKLPNNELEQGYIPMGRLEVARLDNDPNYPENGVLRLTMLGGK